MIFDPLERFLSSLVIFLLFVFSILYISRGLKKKKNEKNEKVLMFGFGIFWFNTAITRLIFYIFDYFLEGTYIGDLNVIIQTYNALNYIFLYLYLYLYYHIFIVVIMVIFLFTWSSFKSKREFQNISSLITIGVTFFLIGWIFESIMIKNSNLITPSLGPIFLSLGIVISTSPLIGHFELFSSPTVKGFIIIMISTLTMFVVLMLLFNLQIVDLFLIIIWVSFSVLISLLGFIVYSYVRRRDQGLQKEEMHETLRMFTKPLKFSVEDIKYSKEKGFCLVCKNKISRLTYVCPICEAWYCIKCCEALIELKNNCWGCETPFARFTPIKYEN